jgi:ATP-dependent exoDNAse (exonuclease V) alpha subunit
MAIIEQDQSFELSRDINTEITKGMMGVILNILEPDKSFEVEFPREDGSRYGDKTFTISIDDILVESLA